MRSQGAAFAFEGVPARETSRAFLEQALRGRREETDHLIVTVPAPAARPGETFPSGRDARDSAGRRTAKTAAGPCVPRPVRWWSIPVSSDARVGQQRAQLYICVKRAPRFAIPLRLGV